MHAASRHHTQQKDADLQIGQTDLGLKPGQIGYTGRSRGRLGIAAGPVLPQEPRALAQGGGLLEAREVCLSSIPPSRRGEPYELEEMRGRTAIVPAQFSEPPEVDEDPQGPETAQRHEIAERIIGPLSLPLAVEPGEQVVTRISLGQGAWHGENSKGVAAANARRPARCCHAEDATRADSSGTGDRGAPPQPVFRHSP